MKRVFKSKIHRATVTHADVNYEGSLTIDPQLMEMADIKPYEEVHVWNVTRGSRLTTYAIKGEPGSRVICVNGAAAHLTEVGDLIIIATFDSVTEIDENYVPTVLLLDEVNNPKSIREEVAGPNMPTGHSSNDEFILRAA